MLLEFHFWTITIAIISNYNKMMSAIAHTLKFELIAKLFAAIQSIWSYVLIYVTKAVCSGASSLADDPSWSTPSSLKSCIGCKISNNAVRLGKLISLLHGIP